MELSTQSAPSGNTAGDLSHPPALPIKQRRSHNSCSSSPDPELDIDVSSPFAQTRRPSHAAVPVTDCHAVECPIHHLPGQPGSHMVRFLSDSTPPPLPKKRLSRTLSLPAGALFQQCPLHPLCTLPPMEPPSEGSLESRLALLSFDTPDSWLPGLFHNFQSQVEVSVILQQRHLLFLRSAAQKLEKLLFEEELTVAEAESLQPTDFVLWEECQPRHIGNSIFYPVLCPKYPGRTFAAKVFKCDADRSNPAHPEHLPPHVNVQQAVTYFPRSPKQQQLLRGGGGAENALEASQQCPVSPPGSAGEPQRNTAGRTLLALMPECRTAAIVREVPCGTLKDFWRDGAALYRSEPEVYERRLVLLLLQVTQGLQHLRKHSAACVDLQPESIMLVWPSKEREDNGSELQGNMQVLWKKRGTPRAMLANFQLLSEAKRPGESEEFQLSGLLQYCLQASETSSLHSTRRSLYSRPLLQLATVLLQGELKVPDAAGILQVLLWGPRTEILKEGPSLLPNWLLVKRSLLILKLAERGLPADRCSLDWEDCLCLQYYCLTSAENLLRSSSILGLHCLSH
ncbi:pseudopodium-enriched atypical kinase 1-like [Arapaima gigas]